MTVLVLFVEYFSRQFSLLQLVRSTGNRCSITKNGAIYYRPQRSWGKVIFSQASVILSTGSGLRGVCLVPRVWSWWGVPALGGVWSRGGAWWRTPGTTAADGTHPTGMHSCLNFFLTKSYIWLPSMAFAEISVADQKENREKSGNPKSNQEAYSAEFRY